MMTVAAVAQLLIALAFVSIPLVRHATVPPPRPPPMPNWPVRVCAPGGLAENGMRFDAGGHETWAPVGIALVMTAIAFARKGDPELARIDVQSFLDVAEAAFPAGGPRTCRTCATSSSSAVRSWS
ncbi:hypothetical protein AB0J47_37215 [Nocardia sp. NPDC049737]|uniref:hypothetical protein n=1 Tax=Nocardia sp. NPDC049737 TaxID=3154358 RepID=UPI00343046B2